MSNQLKQKYYQALLNKDPLYDGIFYVGITTTGIFCRNVCSARKPKFENCEFFQSPKEALISGFRACKRCRPLAPPNSLPYELQQLLVMVQKEPEKRWKEADIMDLGLDLSTIRRQFRKRFGMTFIQYARAIRMGIAMKEIRKGKGFIDAQLSANYESSSGFRDAFAKIMGDVPNNLRKGGKVLYASWIDTPIGPMIAIGDDEYLYLLEFVERRALENEIIALRKETKSPIIPGVSAPVESIRKELTDYFSGKLNYFTTPIKSAGSAFQKQVWEELKKIPYGQTISYAELAKKIQSPKACRAVARANGTNRLALIIPCHRVINSSGEIGGYGGGIHRKEWLIRHEKNSMNEIISKSQLLS